MLLCLLVVNTLGPVESTMSLEAGLILYFCARYYLVSIVIQQRKHNCEWYMPRVSQSESSDTPPNSQTHPNIFARLRRAIATAGGGYTVSADIFVLTWEQPAATLVPRTLLVATARHMGLRKV